MLKPFSQACVNNRDFILEQLGPLLSNAKSVLEVGSGTGQHAVYFSGHLPDITWQTSDLDENHQGINAWITEAGEENCLAPISLNVADKQWLPHAVDAIFTANSLHIMSWDYVTHFFNKVPHVLTPSGLLIAYGPFNYDGEYTSESNQRFDQLLRASNTGRGIRDIERINMLAVDNGLQFVVDHAMPANNRLIVWQYQP